ncbi:MAG: helix-turn-helix transcriptional regulator [Proteobacteria bacterium]|nr:helix-turn-helix transcriptional regulator [Pseudomonadota bacterium]
MAIAMARKEDLSQFETMTNASTKLSMIVGENLRHLRRQQGLSLEQLAAVSGVSRAMLGQIETGKSAPTINLLGRIAEALGVSISGLIASPSVKGTIVIPHDRAMIVASSEGGFVSRALFPWGEPQTVEVFEVTIAPHFVETFRPSPPISKKTLVMIAGQLQISVGEGAPTQLSGGDAALFNADVAHSFFNPGDCDAKALLVSTSFEAVNSRNR